MSKRLDRNKKMVFFKWPNLKKSSHQMYITQTDAFSYPNFREVVYTFTLMNSEPLIYEVVTYMKNNMMLAFVAVGRRWRKRWDRPDELPFRQTSCEPAKEPDERCRSAEETQLLEAVRIQRSLLLWKMNNTHIYFPNINTLLYYLVLI